MWIKVKRTDPRACALADRHYSRQSVGSKSFMPPARTVVLLNDDATAVFGMSWPYAHLALHGKGDYWMCTIFRNESEELSSVMIREAIKCCYDWWKILPDDGVMTYVDPGKVRRKRDWGRCFRKAGFVPDGYSKSGLVYLRMDRPTLDHLLGTVSLSKEAS